MLRILVVDDESNIRNMIAGIVNGYCEGASVIGQAGSVREAKQKIEALSPDLVLLDVRMDDGTGFDLLEQLERIDFRIIFITAYQEYALQAIKLSALDYILKPVNPDELIQAVNNARSRTLEMEKVQIGHLVNSMGNGQQFQKKILLKTAESIHLVDLDEIICCEATGGYTLFSLMGNRQVLVSRNLSGYEELFSTYSFFRVHKSYLVNLQRILRFDKEDGGYLVMEEDRKVPVASRKREQLFDLLKRITE